MRRHTAITALLIVGVILTGCFGGQSGLKGYRVSGRVVNSDGIGIPEVTLTFSGDFGIAITDEEGYWAKDGLSGTVTITAMKEGWVFEAREVSGPEEGVDFVGIKKTYPLVTSVKGQGKIEEEVILFPQTQDYEHGTQVRLRAVPESGWLFSHWEGDLEGTDNPAVLLVDGAKSVTAVFVRAYTLHLVVEGEGQIEVTPEQDLYPEGTVVALSVVPYEGWEFVGWGGDASGSSPKISVTMDSNKSIKAAFARKTYELSITVLGQGYVDEEIVLTSQGTKYDHGTRVRLTAVPASGWIFDHWEDDLEGTDNPVEVLMESQKSITAVFVQAYTLDLEIEGEGWIEAYPEQELYPEGMVVNLTAIAAEGWAFTRWEGDASGANPDISLTMDNDKSVKAVFEKEKYTLTLGTIGNGTVTVYPEQAYYHWGDTVTLVAEPDYGWYLAGWSDVYTTSKQRTLSITGNTTITAEFRPIEDGFSTLFYGNIRIGDRVYQMTFYITNLLPFGVGLNRVEIRDHNNSIFAYTEDPALLSGNYLYPGATVALQIDPVFPPYQSDVLTWTVHWYVVVDGEEYTIICPYGSGW